MKKTKKQMQNEKLLDLYLKKLTEDPKKAVKLKKPLSLIHI